MCGDCVSVIKCYDCGSKYCFSCDRNVHGNGLLHSNWMYWTGSFFKNLPPHKFLTANSEMLDS